ncbi:triosephosphate isomerase [Thalassobaculum fulvum]|uniref:Triosephosphate isomerase n=1 Tax=Thalassobaculum fulvum TaxID=1633335 RepID=A0A919CNZ1_9PROT|nr:triosephosphate isomerase [Thalassobaculum fulvum]
MALRPLIAGNWKMNLDRETAAGLARELAGAVAAAAAFEMAVCPPAPYLIPVADAIAGSPVGLGAQDCHAAANGAHTGDVAAPMLTDVGCTYVIVGHSERRADHGETDAVVRAKAEAARSVGLVPIVCVGETEAQRDAGETLDVVGRQVAGSIPDGLDGTTLVVAYEPVWAIGTGRTPTVDDVAAVHAHIRAALARKSADAAGIRILYGGSVKPSNASELLAVANVDGALVGGASLKAADFLAIARAV